MIRVDLYNIWKDNNTRLKAFLVLAFGKYEREVCIVLLNFRLSIKY
jgi:hypothetical protein